MEPFTSQDAKDLILSTNGKFFTVVFIKRGNGEIREMTCRLGVKKHLRGGEAAYSFENKGLISIWEPEKGYRCIPVEGIISITFQKQTYTVTSIDTFSEVFAN